MMENPAADDSIINDIIELVISTAGPDLVLLFVRQGDELLLRASGPHTINDRFGEVKIHQVGECLCGLAALDGKPVYSHDIGCDHRCTWEECKKAGFSSFAALPLISNDQVIGVLGLASIKSRDFSERSGLLSLIARTLSISLNEQLALEKQRGLEAAVQAERLFSDVALDSLPCVFYQISATHSFLRWNRTLEIVTGYSAEEIATMSPLDLFHCDDRDRVRSRMEAVFSEGYADVEAEFTVKTGEHIPYFFTGKRVELGGMPSLVGMGIDITERKRADEELHKNEALYRSLFQSNPHPMWIYDLDTLRFLAVNDAAVSHYGYSLDEFLSMTIKDIRPPEDVPLLYANLKNLPAEGVDNAGVWRHVKKDGSVIDVEITSHVRNHDGRRTEVVLAHDITERRRAEMELQESQKLLESVVEHIPLMIFLKEAADLRFVVFNQAGEELLGYDRKDLLGKNNLDLFPPEQAAWFMAKDREVLAAGTMLDIPEEPILTAGKGERLLHTRKVCITGGDGTPKYLLGISEDITEHKRAEEERIALEKQMLHAQKLESLGVLAGGIAHDFNNILTSIIGNADLALRRLNPESPALENLDRIEKAAIRAADLARQMLAYSGKGRFVIENIDLNRLVEEMFHMLKVSISKKAVLRLNPYHPLPSVEADATQMRQVIMNLVINASEAIGDRSGVIAVTTGVMNCDRHYLQNVWLNDNISAGLYVYLEIADTGCGMDKETIDKLFDPFFTTKFTGRGLGMAAVLGIVRGHKGAIKVYSEPNRGTTFKILLPASSTPAELFNENSSDDHWQGSGTVLLVDDEETVRGIGSEMLRELGFQVITANDGREAVEIYRNTLDINFVILDLTMPHMDGEQCFRELRQLNHNVKVIISSGFSENEVTQKFTGKGLAGFIQKPYRLSVLKEAIKRI